MPARYYCPAGTTNRLVVEDGEGYTLPETASQHNRVDVAPCPDAYICVNGTRSPMLYWTTDCAQEGVAIQTVAENQPLGRLSNVQAAASDFGEIRYSLAPQPNFSIDEITGEIWVANGGLNFEEQSSYELSVTASMGNTSIQCTVQVQVLDVNDPPKLLFVDGDAESFSVPENAPAFTAIGQPVQAFDEDVAQVMEHDVPPHVSVES